MKSTLGIKSALVAACIAFGASLPLVAANAAEDKAMQTPTEKGHMEKGAMEKGEMEKGAMEKGAMEKGEMEKGAMEKGAEHDSYGKKAEPKTEHPK